MKLKNNIFIGYGIICTLMALVVAWAVLNLFSLRRAAGTILLNNYRSVVAVEKMGDALARQDAGILVMFLGDTEMGLTIFRENEAAFLEQFGIVQANMNDEIARERGADFLERFGILKNDVNNESARDLIQSIDEGYRGYRRQFSAMTERKDSGNNISSSPLELYQESVLPLFLMVRDSCTRLRTLNEQTILNATVRTGDVAGRAIWSTVAAAIAGLITVYILSLLLAGRITKPLYRLMDAARKISSGDYSVQVESNTKDELGKLTGEFNKMAQQLYHYREIDIEKIITEKNKNEGIISSIDDGLVVFNTDMKVASINPAARKVLGLEFMDVAKMECADIFQDGNVCEMIRKTIETGAPQKDIPDEQRIIMMKREGKTYQYMFSITVTKGKNNDLSGILLLLRDVTRMKEVERLRNDFVMAASHELRTPLTSMGMSIDLLLEHVAPKLSDKDKDLILTAHEEVRRMKALTNDLLDLSKIEAGKISLDLNNIKVQNFFDQIQEVFRKQIEMKKVALTSSHSENIASVEADENKIMWVLSNLVSNALRYVPQRDGYIKLSADRVGQYVHVSVYDNGPGIPLEYQSKIFQKFVQIDGQESGGTGLGLAICKEIVRAHRGTIWVESSPGNGSTFTFTLPVSE